MDEMRVLGVVLAAGASRRFGYDKSEAPLVGRTLLEWVIERARPQVEELMLNTNAPSPCSGIEHLPDEAPGEGPLAGILAGLNRAEGTGFTHVATFACDTPFFPRDTVSKLSAALHQSHADFAAARCGVTLHRIFALWPVSCRSRLEAAFAADGRSMYSVESWLTPVWYEFPARGGPDGDPFFNINTRDDLAIAERWARASL